MPEVHTHHNLECIFISTIRTCISTSMAPKNVQKLGHNLHRVFSMSSLIFMPYYVAGILVIQVTALI